MITLTTALLRSPLQLWSGCAPTAAAPLPREHAVTSPTVQFEIHTQGGRTSFTEGESIGIALSFSSNVPDHYELDAATYDRSGRLHIDEYIVTPDAPDPLADWFDAGIGEMGGLRQMPMLGPVPTVINRDLAEYRRLAPGHYTLVVNTARVTSDDGPVPLRSAPLSLTITPAEPSRADRQATQAADLIDTSPDEETRRAAARELRFLGTERAAREMAARLGRGDPGSTDFELNFGLVGSPHRALVLSLLDDSIVDPARPVGSGIVQTLALLRAAQRWPEPLGPWPLEPEAQRRWQETSAERQAHRTEVQASILSKLREALPNKTAAARPTCVETLQQFDWSSASQTGDDTKASPEELRAVFPELSADRQQHLLAHYWLRFADPSLAPYLERIAGDTTTQEPLRVAAMKRLLEISPAAGRTLVLDEIARSEPTLQPWAIDVLRSLPDETLPSLDALLGARLSGVYVPDRELYLIERYGSPALAAPVEALLSKGSDSLSDGVFEAGIAYLLRVRPASGERLLRAALAKPQQRLYRTRLLRSIGILQPHPCIESISIELLDDPDPNVAAEAANALARHGGKDAEAALWRRLTRFHDDWARRAADLVYRRTSDNPNQSQVNLENALWGALGRGHGFWMGPEGAKRLASLVVSEQGIDQVRFVKPSEPPELSVYVSYGGELQLRVAQYEFDSLDALKKKLAQFPKNSHFRLVSHGWGPQKQEQAVLEEVRAQLRALGLSWTGP